MKQMIFSAVAALFFLGMNAQADTLRFDQADQKIMNALDDEGYLSELSDSQLRTVGNIVSETVARELSDGASFNLTEEGQQAFLKDALSSIKEKISSALKSLKDKAKTIVAKYGPMLSPYASKSIAALQPKAEELARKHGLPLNVVKGAFGKLSEAAQKKLAADPVAAEKQLLASVGEK
jgi:hypothetical protein